MPGPAPFWPSPTAWHYLTLYSRHFSIAPEVKSCFWSPLYCYRYQPAASWLFPAACLVSALIFICLDVNVIQFSLIAPCFLHWLAVVGILKWRRKVFIYFAGVIFACITMDGGSFCWTLPSHLFLRVVGSRGLPVPCDESTEGFSVNPSQPQPHY